MGYGVYKEPGVFDLQGFKRVAILLKPSACLPGLRVTAKGVEKVLKGGKEFLIEKSGVRVTHAQCKKSVQVGKSICVIVARS